MLQREPQLKQVHRGIKEFKIMSYFAEIKNNIVQRVIVADSKEWCEQNLGGNWIETFTDQNDKNYAGIGHTYDIKTDNFISAKPFPSWSLDIKQKWVAPIAKTPDDVGWDEKNQKWLKMAEVINSTK